MTFLFEQFLEFYINKQAAENEKEYNYARVNILEINNVGIGLLLDLRWPTNVTCNISKILTTA